MTKEQFDTKYAYKANVAIHCNTEEKAIKLLMLASHFGYEWCDGTSFLEETNYHNMNDDTVYYIKDGTFGSITFARYCSADIVEFDRSNRQKKYQ